MPGRSLNQPLRVLNWFDVHVVDIAADLSTAPSNVYRWLEEGRAFHASFLTAVEARSPECAEALRPVIKVMS